MILDDFLWLFFKNLWVINNVLTIKMLFTTNKVVYVLPGAGSKRQKQKTWNFTTKEILGIKVIE